MCAALMLLHENLMAPNYILTIKRDTPPGQDFLKKVNLQLFFLPISYNKFKSVIASLY